MKRIFFLLVSTLMMLVPQNSFAGEDYMNCKATNEVITPQKPYLEYIINIGNDNGYDSYISSNVSFTVDGTTWDVGNFIGNSPIEKINKYPDNHEYKGWVFNETKGDMTLKAGQAYRGNDPDEDNYYAIFRVYFSHVYERQIINYSWRTAYRVNQGDNKNFSGSGRCSVNFGNDLKLTNISTTISTSDVSFTTSATTPKNAGEYSYEVFLLKENITDLATTIHVNQGSWRTTAKGSGQVMAVTVKKDPELYFTTTFYSYYTISHTSEGHSITCHYKGEKAVDTKYPLEGSGTSADPFLIWNEKNLDIFRQMVNESHRPDVCGKLMADINYSGYSGVNNMIGTVDYPYSGTFDGNGKQLKVGFNLDVKITGLFRYIKNATITNLFITGSLTTNQNITGILVGNAQGNCTLSYIVNGATLNSSFSGDSSLGGFVGEIGGSNQGNVDFKYCGFQGSLLAAACHSFGGFTGWLYGNGYATAEGCFFAPQELTIQSNNAYTFIRCNAAERYTIRNCFYDFKQEGGYVQGTEVTLEQMKSGEVCHRLNGSTNNNAVWLQTIGSNNFPTLWNAQRVFKIGEYYRNSMPQFKGTGTIVDPILIGTPQELESFRDLVNDGLSTLCAKLTADIDMSDRNWIPIGVYDDKHEFVYQGTFDGDGFIISNLSGNNASCHEMGLVGRSSEGCVVKNVLMYNVHLEGKFRAAPIVGLISGKTTIQDCGVYGLVKLAYLDTTTQDSTKGKGGIAGWNHQSGSFKNLFTVYDNIHPGAVELVSDCCFSKSKVESWAATGQLCYELNGKSSDKAVWKQTLGKQAYPQIRLGLKVGYNGQYYNINYQDADNTTYNNPLSSEDIQVVHYGGRLYELIVTLGTSDGEIWHAYPDMTLAYKADDKWINIGELVNINRERLGYDKEWSGELKSTQGVFVNGHTFQVQTPVFWINHSEKKNKKQACLFWIAPSDLKVLPQEFRFSASKPENNLVMTNITTTGSAPTDGSVILVEPQINMETNQPGSQMGSITLTATAYSLAFWDCTDNTFISVQEQTAGFQSLQYVLPPVERTHQIVALMYGTKVAMNGMKMDTTYVTYSYPFTQKPIHSILRSNAKVSYNGSNTLRWAIAYPENADLYTEDPFVVYRAYQSDYSDAAQLESFDLANYSSTSTENDSIFGWYSYQDTSEEGKNTTVKYDETKSAFDDWDLTGEAKNILTAYKYPARYIYYKVNRAIPYAMWGDTRAYTKTWKVLLTNVLPRVDTIKVSRTSDWDKTHRVQLRLKLLNPYPYQLVPANEQEAVQSEAKKQGIIDRMFSWDEKAKIIIKRFCPENEWYQDIDEVAKTIEISGSQVEYNAAEGYYYVDVEDLQSAPYTHYYYEAWVDGSESNYPVCSNMTAHARSSDADANACYTTAMADIQEFVATVDEEDGVKLSWIIDSSLKTTYTLVRKLYQCGYDAEETKALGNASTVAADTTLISGDYNATELFDDAALAANAYEYDLTAKVTFHGKDYPTSTAAYGSKKYTNGSISGYVRMPNGTAMPGKVKVRLSLVSPKTLNVKDITAPNGAKVLKGYSKDNIVYEVEAQSNGFFKIDSLCYYGTGIQYEVQAICDGAEFVGPTGTSNSFVATLEDKKHVYSNTDFICNNTHQFSGRILYANSTVPVSGMTFTVNGQLLKKTNGTNIVTDANGNFSFSVPKMLVTIQASKEGHKLSGEGYILGGPQKNQKEFVPTEDYHSVVLTDSTTVRLVGRVAGGDVESAKPLGFGLTQNIIGDSITVMLQLEGNNTSYLYYNAKNPDETHKEQRFTQEVQSGNNTEKKIPTTVEFQSKRIVVKANNATGEFCLDLIPAKYKIAQIYAEGYPTLYNEGEGLQVLDLTETKKNSTHSYNSLTTSYAAAYQHTYHAPVQVTLSQGNNVIFGEENITVNILSGKEQKINVAWKENEKGKYTFKYPVFQSMKSYSITVHAQENYYYNNDPQKGKSNTVNIVGKNVTLINGFSDNVFKPKPLDATGKASFNVIPTNTTFSFTGEKALMTLRGVVDIDGRYYESDTLKAYVTGKGETGVEVSAALEGQPQILDIIRDPYGANSYAYREKGTQYSWTAHYEKQELGQFNFNIGLGVGFITHVGWGVTAGTEHDWMIASLDFNKITQNQYTQEDGEYHLTINERISTSSDPHDVGAMADVYIGCVSTVDIVRGKEFNVIDETTYEYLKEAIEQGYVKVVSEGVDNDKKKRYLVIADYVGTKTGKERIFAYTQKYILGTLIPNLERDYAQAKVDSLAGNGSATKNYLSKIKEWQTVIENNEKAKVGALKAADSQSKSTSVTPTKSDSIQGYNFYSISGATVEHSEEGTSYYRKATVNGACPFTWNLGSDKDKQSNNIDTSTNDISQEVEKDENGNEKEDQRNRHNTGACFLLELSIGGGQTTNVTNSIRNYKTSIAGTGYVLSTTDNSYIDMDVVKYKDSSLKVVDEFFMSNINNYEGGGDYNDMKTDTSGVNNKDEYKITDDKCVSNYFFIQRGGASRNPWSDADSTFFYKENNKRLPLGGRSLRIDNPKIYVENPVVNNQPQDEAAIFTIRLANETEINDKSKYLNPSTLYLTVDEASNPDGAQLSIDGQPLRNGMPFYLNPGDAVVKTLEVRRGGKPMDYNNIKLQFTDNPDMWKLVSEATISVHYVPASSPVNISKPANNWLINTLSQVNKGSYYIPVEIDGFSTTKYDNFDHIELQYKKQTESDDQWVNLCSFYADKALYDKATCAKEMIVSEKNKISYDFYGEKDPIEMKYDLRAVSFCRLGNGYVTRISNIVSGTKDTRNPEVFGKPKPSNGILTFSDVISLPFSEPIAYNYLDETVNFSVQGYTNNSDADHSAYIYFPGSANQLAEACIDADAGNGDLTIEMMVKTDKDIADLANFISVENKDVNKSFRFGYMSKEDCLFAKLGTTVVKSEKLKPLNFDLTQAMTHVALTYSADESTAHFFVGEQEVAKQGESVSIKSENVVAQGPLKLGVDYKGAMADVRIWGRVLSTYELATKYKKMISTSERNLLAYWPMNETSGNVLIEKVGGMNINLTDVSWQTPVGYSVRLDGKPMQLTTKAEMKFNRNNAEDFTLGFWFKCDGSKDNSNAILFAAGSDNLQEKGMDKMRIGFINKELVLTSEGNTLSFGSKKDALHDTWHHLAVSVNHSLNVASLFVDGVMTNETNAENLGGITSSYVAFGNNNFYGNIDNVTLWSMALPASYINQYYNTDCTGREAELLINMNFEQTQTNPQGTPVLSFSPYNNVIVKETGKIAGDSLVDEKIVKADAKMYAPIRTGGGLQNLPFTWKSTDDELLININKTDASINNQQVNLVVRNVEDLNGNVMKNAQMWSVYVNRNVLAWDEDKLNIVLDYGKDTTFVMGWKNLSGRVISYTIDNSANWLQLTNVMGTMLPLSSDETTVRIADGLAPGSYNTYINLIDENNLISKMKLKVNVVAKEPEWEMDTTNVNGETMNVIGVVKKQIADDTWIVDMNPYDIVAAFIEKKCVGKSYLKVDPVTNSSYVYLSIHGNSKLTNPSIEFRLWSADEGKVYELTNKEPLTYSNKKIVGLNQPYELRTSNRKYQNIELRPGWNWVSLNVQISGEKKGPNALFSDISQLSKGDLIRRMGDTQFSTLQSDAIWDKSLESIPLLKSNVYQIYAHNPGTVVAEGEAFTNDNREVEFTFPNKDSWADLAYLLEVSQPINLALTDFVAGSEKAPAGSIIKSRNEFAVATSDGHWVGSLEYMRPGVGYYVKCNYGKSNVTVRVKYTNIIDSQTNAPQPTSALPSTSTSSSTSMPIIATFAEGEYKEGDVLLAIANGEVVGAAEAQSSPMGNSQQPTAEVYFLSASAEQGSNLQFVKLRDGKPVAVSTKKFTYDADLVAGTLEHPYVVDFTATEGNDIYDLSGIKHFNLKSLNQRGIYIQNGRKLSR